MYLHFCIERVSHSAHLLIIFFVLISFIVKPIVEKQKKKKTDSHSDLDMEQARTPVPDYAERNNHRDTLSFSFFLCFFFFFFFFPPLFMGGGGNAVTLQVVLR